jgi:hypothetical protein
MRTSTFSSSLKYAFLFYVFLLRFILYAPSPFYALHLFHARQLLCTDARLPSTCMKNKNEKANPLFCSAYIFHANSSARSSTQLFFFPGDYAQSIFSSFFIMLRLFFISGHYPEILWLLWQLCYSTLFHLSIVSMMSLHSIGSYLETLYLL